MLDLREGVTAESVRDGRIGERGEGRGKGGQEREEWEWSGPDQLWEEIDTPAVKILKLL